MMQTIETPEQPENVFYPEEAQSLEVIPDKPFSYAYTHDYYPKSPTLNQMMGQSEKDAFSPALIEEEKGTREYSEYLFDIRRAVIASEILNRKY
jgi:hypothetical protein